MNSTVKVVLAAIVACAVLGGLYFLVWDPVLGGLRWDLSGAPDRSDVVKQYLQRALYTSEGLEIIRCKQVRNSAIEAARQQYPGLEIVDVYFRHKNPAGDLDTNISHFYILDNRVIQSQGLTYREAHSSDPNEEEFLKQFVERNKTPRDQEAEKRQFEAQKDKGKGKGGMPPMGGFGKGKGGDKGGFPGKGFPGDKGFKGPPPPEGPGKADPAAPPAEAKPAEKPAEKATEKAEPKGKQ